MTTIHPYYNAKFEKEPSSQGKPVDPITAYQEAGMGPFANKLTQEQDPWTSYLQLLQRGQVPAQYGVPSDPRGLLPQSALIPDEEGRTTYQLPTVGEQPNTPYSQELIDAYLRSDMKGTTIEEELLEPVDISKVHPYYGAQRKESEVFKEYEAMKEQQMMDAMGWDPELAMKDIERVQELGPDNAQNLRNLATMSLRMMQMDDPEMKANAQAILHLFKDYEPFHNIFDAETNGTTTYALLYEPPKEPSRVMKLIGHVVGAIAPIAETGNWLRKVAVDIKQGEYKSAVARLARGGLNAAGEIGDIFAYMALPPLALVKAGEVAMSKAGWGNNSEFMDKLIDPLASFAGNPIGSVTNKLEDAITDSGVISDRWKEFDSNDDGFLGFFEAVGNPDYGKDWFGGGKLGWTAHHIMELGGLIGSDPISIASAGAGHVAKTAIRQMSTALGVLNKEAGGVAKLWITLGDDAALAQSKAVRAAQLVAHGFNKTPIKNATAMDKQIIKDLLHFARAGDEATATLGSKGGYQKVLLDATAKQNKKIARSAERVMKRTGGGIFATYPSVFATGKGIGVVDHLVPGTRRLYQWTRSAGYKHDTWEAVVRYIPLIGTATTRGVAHGAARIQTGAKGFHDVRTQFDKANKIIEILRKGANQEEVIDDYIFQTLGDVPVTGPQSVTRGVSDLGLPESFGIEDFIKVIKTTDEEAAKILRFFEDTGIITLDTPVIGIQRGANTKWRWVMDTGEVTTYSNASDRLLGMRNIIDQARRDGFNSLDEVAASLDAGLETSWATAHVDTVVEMGWRPRGAPETWIQKRNAAFMERAPIKALKNMQEKVSTFHKAGSAQVFSADEARAYSSMAVKTAQANVETTKQILTRHFGKVISALRRARPEWTDEEIREVAGRVVNTYKSADNRNKAMSALKNEYSQGPRDTKFLNEVEAFSRNLDVMSQEWDDWLRMVKGADYSKKEPRRYMPRRVDTKTTEMVNDWLAAGNEIGRKLYNDLTNRDEVFRYMQESDDFIKMSKTFGGKTEAEQVAWMRGQAEAYVNFIKENKKVGLGRFGKAKAAFGRMPDEKKLTTMIDANSSGHLSARVFLSDVENVVEVNKVMREILEKAAERHVKAGNSDWAITNFYSVDPVDQWMRYVRGNNDALLINDLTLNLQKLQIMDDVGYGITHGGAFDPIDVVPPPPRPPAGPAAGPPPAPLVPKGAPTWSDEHLPPPARKLTPEEEAMDAFDAAKFRDEVGYGPPMPNIQAGESAAKAIKYWEGVVARTEVQLEKALAEGGPIFQKGTKGAANMKAHQLKEKLVNSKNKLERYQGATRRVTEAKKRDTERVAELTGVKKELPETLPEREVVVKQLTARQEVGTKTKASVTDLDQRVPEGAKLYELPLQDRKIIEHWIRKARFALFEENPALLSTSEPTPGSLLNVQRGTTQPKGELITSKQIAAADKAARGTDADLDPTKLIDMAKDGRSQTFPYINHPEAPEAAITMQSHLDLADDIIETSHLGQLPVKPILDDAFKDINDQLGRIARDLKIAKDTTKEFNPSALYQGKRGTRRTINTKQEAAGTDEAIIAMEKQRLVDKIKNNLIHSKPIVKEADNVVQEATVNLNATQATANRQTELHKSYGRRFGTEEGAPTAIWTSDEQAKGVIPQRGHKASNTFEGQELDLRGPQPNINDLRDPLPISDHKLDRVISGGQTGADRTGLEVAAEMGIPTGGNPSVNAYVKSTGKQTFKTGEDVSVVPYVVHKDTVGKTVPTKKNLFGDKGPEKFVQVTKNAYNNREQMWLTDQSLKHYMDPPNTKLGFGYPARTARNVIDADATVIIDLQAFDPSQISQARFFNKITGGRKQAENWTPTHKNSTNVGVDTRTLISQEGSDYSGLYPAGSGSQDTLRYARGEYVDANFDYGARKAGVTDPSTGKVGKELPTVGNIQANELTRPVLVLKDSDPQSLRWFHEWLKEHNVKTLNVAGNANVGQNAREIVRVTREIMESLEPVKVAAVKEADVLPMSAPKGQGAVEEFIQTLGNAKAHFASPQAARELADELLKTRPTATAKDIWLKDYLNRKVIPIDEVEQVSGEATLWHGAFEGQESIGLFIDSKTGDLVLDASTNFSGKQVGISFTDDLAVAKDYATRVKGQGGDRSKGLIFEIDRKTVEGMTELFEESGEEIATRGSQTLRIPKNKFRTIDTRTKKDIAKQQEWEKDYFNEISKMTDEELGKRHFDLVGSGELMEHQGRGELHHLIAGDEISIVRNEIKNRLHTKKISGELGKPAGGPTTYMPDTLFMSQKVANVPTGGEKAIEWVKDGSRKSMIRSASYLNKNFKDLKVGSVVAMGDENNHVFVKVTKVRKLKDGWTKDKRVLAELSETELWKPNEIARKVYKGGIETPKNPRYYIKFEKIGEDAVPRQPVQPKAGRLEGKAKPADRMTANEIEREWTQLGGHVSDLKSGVAAPRSPWESRVTQARQELDQAKKTRDKLVMEAEEATNEELAKIAGLKSTDLVDGKWKIRPSEVDVAPPNAKEIVEQAQQMGIPNTKKLGEHLLKGQEGTDVVPLLNNVIEWVTNNFPEIAKQAPKKVVKYVKDDARLVTHNVNAKPINIVKGNRTGRFAPLSNLAYRPFKFKPRSMQHGGEIVEREFLSVEHAYQSLKSGRFNEKVYNKYNGVGAKGTTPDNWPRYRPMTSQNQLLKTTYSKNDWNIELMEDIIRASIKQNDDIAKLLDETGDSPLTHILMKQGKQANKDVWTEKFPEILQKIRAERRLDKAQKQTAESVRDPLKIAKEEGTIIGGGTFNWADPMPPINAEARARLKAAYGQAGRQPRAYIARPGAVEGTFTYPQGGKGDFVFQWKSYRDDTIQTLRGRSMEDLERKILANDELSKYTIHHVGGEKGAVLIDSEISEMITRDVLPRIKDGYMAEGMGNIMHQFNTAWAAYATVPLIAGIGFHARNHGGNWFNMVLAGFRNPKYIHQAMKYQRLNSVVHEHQIEKFITQYNDAVDDLVRVGGRNVGKEKIKLTKHEAKILKQLNHNAVLNGSFFKDLQYDRNIFLSAAGTASTKRARKLLVNNPVIRTGQKVGQAIEDNARIALYLDGVEAKALTPFLAASRVREFLFDYGDLTAQELMVKNNLSRFYTFMRKNTELQARMLMESPGNTINLQRTTESIVKALLGPSDEWRERFLPDWTKQVGRVIGAGGVVTGRFETPAVAALETVERLATIPALLPIIKDGMPEYLTGYDPATGKHDWRGRVNEMTQMLSGGTVSAINYLQEYQSGRSLFTGAILEPGWQNELMRFVNTGIPIVGKTVSTFEKLGLIDWANKHTPFEIDVSVVADHQKLQSELESELTAKERAYFRALGVFFGIETYFLDADQQMRMIGNFRTEWNKIINEAEEHGIDIPTMEELREHGAYSEADSFLTAMFYSADPIRALERGLPAEARRVVTEGFGIDLLETYKNAETDEEKWEEVQTALEMTEMIINKDTPEGAPRKKLSDQDILNIALAHPAFGFGVDELEAFEIEGFRKNVWDKDETSEENLRASEQHLSYMFDQLGINWSYAMELRPRITQAERFWRDGVERGYTTNEIFLEWVDDMSRQTKAELFGTETLDYWNLDKFTSKEDLEKLNDRLREDIATVTIASFIMGINPTQEDIMYFMVYGKDRLTNSQRKALGLPLPKRIPDREDPRTANAINLDTLLKTEAIQSSMPSAPPASLIAG
jgi:hypothetical protein